MILSKRFDVLDKVVNRTNQSLN